MQADVAMEVLGLSGEPTEAELKRAYLRQVKAHPPERDPEGFRRVREAYERLRDGYAAPWVVRPFVAPSPPPPPPSPSVLVEPPVSAAEPTRPEPERVEALPREVQEQLELLQRALASDKPAQAAEIMIWLYARPLLESVPMPAPLLALETLLALMESGRFKRAGELLKALEDYLSKQQAPGGLGNEVAARWKLAGELLAVSQLDSRLARALASAVRGKQWYTAAGAAHAAVEEYGAELGRYMGERAPTLWVQVADLLREYKPDVPSPARVPLERSGGFNFGGWPARVVMLVVINFIRILSAPDHPSRATVDYSPPAPRQDVPVLLPDAPADVARTPLDPAEQQSFGWGPLQQSVRIGDCQTVRERWRPYRATVVRAHANEELEASRKHEILEMCPELQELLEEPP